MAAPKYEFRQIPLQLSNPDLPPISVTTFRAEDSAALQEVHNLESVNSWLRNIPRPYTQAIADNWIALQLAENTIQVIRVMGGEDEGKLIGAVGLDKNDHDDGVGKGGEGYEYEIGYYLHPDYQGKGIMTKAVRAIIKYGREELGIQRLFIRAVVDNKASLGVVQKLVAEEGFVEITGETTDWPVNKGGGFKTLRRWVWHT
jgi:RimJ/RimL family protein N-acetyltransferase